jgi:DNA-directed RNA polymerase subunit alpha
MNNIRFLIPDKYEWDEKTLSSNFGKVIFQPLEQGFGVTVGNSLRRVLLSSIEGDAVTSVKIEGVLHETSPIPGVAEDVLDIIINLKSLVVKSQSDEPQVLYLDVEKEGVVTAADFQPSAMVEICNPELVIATMSAGGHLQLEVTIDSGRGYVSADENKAPHQSIGVIPIDSIFSPVRRVKYNVENTRVENRTDYEKLTMEIWTNGSVAPQDALMEAASILIRHFNVFTDLQSTLDTRSEEKEFAIASGTITGDRQLDRSIEELELSVRAFNCLKAANIKTMRELITYKEEELLKFRNFGKKSLNEIKEILEVIGLSLGMKIVNGVPVKPDENEEIEE